MDNVTKTRRSEIMKSIKSRNTSPEIIVRQFLHNNGLRFRLHDKKLPGKPDIKLTKYKTVILINGCFWHGHMDCNIYVMPKSNVKFWYDKISKNVLRDNKNLSDLHNIGWKVIIVWECQLRGSKREKTLTRLLKDIKY